MLFKAVILGGGMVVVVGWKGERVQPSTYEDQQCLLLLHDYKLKILLHPDNLLDGLD